MHILLYSALTDRIVVLQKLENQKFQYLTKKVCFLSQSNSESIKTAALQRTFRFFYCVAMKKEVIVFENTPHYYDVSITNYDCKQLEGKRLLVAILAVCQPGYKNKLHVWTCLIITLRLRMKREQESYQEHKHVFPSDVWSSNSFSHLQL